jgi:hypothetical protein
MEDMYTVASEGIALSQEIQVSDAAQPSIGNISLWTNSRRISCLQLELLPEWRKTGQSIWSLCDSDCSCEELGQTALWKISLSQNKCLGAGIISGEADDNLSQRLETEQSGWWQKGESTRSREELL